MATHVTGQPPSRLFYVTDRATCLRFLVDTGAQVSVIPLSHIERRNRRADLVLQAVNDTSISTYSTRSLTLDLGLCRSFRWFFVIADVATPILGADFLRCYNLLVDMRRNRLSNAVTSLIVQGIQSQVSSLSPTLLPRKPKRTFEALLAEFPAVTQPCSTEQPVKHSITHHITTTGPQSPPGPAALLQNDSRSHAGSSSTCYSLASFAHHPATSLLPCTWCQKNTRRLAPSTMLRLQIATLSHTSRISPIHSMELPFSPKSI